MVFELLNLLVWKILIHKPMYRQNMFQKVNLLLKLFWILNNLILQNSLLKKINLMKLKKILKQMLKHYLIKKHCLTNLILKRVTLISYLKMFLLPIQRLYLIKMNQRMKKQIPIRFQVVILLLKPIWTLNKLVLQNLLLKLINLPYLKKILIQMLKYYLIQRMKNFVQIVQKKMKLLNLKK